MALEWRPASTLDHCVQDLATSWIWLATLYLGLELIFRLVNNSGGSEYIRASGSLSFACILPYWKGCEAAQHPINESSQISNHEILPTCPPRHT